MASHTVGIVSVQDRIHSGWAFGGMTVGTADFRTGVGVTDAGVRSIINRRPLDTAVVKARH
jgi:hypothetical protein